MEAYKSVFESDTPEEIEVTPAAEVDAAPEAEVQPEEEAVDLSKLTPQELAAYQAKVKPAVKAAETEIEKQQMQNSLKRYKSMLEGITLHTESFFREEETIDANEEKGAEADNKDMFCPNCGASNSNPYRIGTLEGGAADKLRICANCGTVAKEEEFKKAENRTGQADLNAAK
jgi:hypothetical protein